MRAPVGEVSPAFAFALHPSLSLSAAGMRIEGV